MKSPVAFFLAAVLVLCAQCPMSARKQPSERWSVEKAQAWGRENPWYCGVNFVPSNAINDVEIWSKETFSPELIQKELSLASGLGMNCVRIFLQYKVYEDDPKWFLSAFERFVKIADACGLKVMPVLFDDCMFGTESDPHMGKQTDPLPGWTMWGWVPSPGRTMVVDYRTHDKLEEYVKAVISRHRNDKRIFVWDLYNEPDNSTGNLSGYSCALARKCFKWAREASPSQPLTIGIWNGDENVNEIATEESDIISFHAYRDSSSTRSFIRELSVHGRPMICTEWLHRAIGCTVPACLGIYKETGVGCILWGLVNGKTQDHLPFGYRAEDGPYEGVWKHDLYRSDYTPYDPADLEVIRNTTKGE